MSDTRQCILFSKQIEIIKGASGFYCNESLSTNSGNACAEKCIHNTMIATAMKEAASIMGSPVYLLDNAPLKEEGNIDYYYDECPSEATSCSDNDCPCANTALQPGEGYMYISPEAAEFRKDAKTPEEVNIKANQLAQEDPSFIEKFQKNRCRIMGILICEVAAKQRNLNLAVASEDAEVWWKTGKVPLRATPTENNIKYDDIADEVRNKGVSYLETIISNRGIGRWSQVALAARCARYVERSVLLILKDEPDFTEYKSKLNNGITIAELFAKNSGGDTDTAHRLGMEVIGLITKFTNSDRSNSLEYIKNILIVMPSIRVAANAVFAAETYSCDRIDDGKMLVKSSLECAQTALTKLGADEILNAMIIDLSYIIKISDELDAGDDAPFNLDLLPPV